jgi:hypothetical protein
MIHHGLRYQMCGYKHQHDREDVGRMCFAGEGCQAAEHRPQRVRADPGEVARCTIGLLVPLSNQSDEGAQPCTDDDEDEEIRHDVDACIDRPGWEVSTRTGPGKNVRLRKQVAVRHFW